MRHILLTRYNIRTQFAANVDPLDPDWLDHRSKLFRRFCLPSIERQTEQDFDWFIFFHPETPPQHYLYLEGVASIILAERKGAALRLVRESLSEGPLLSTRIDTDDAVAPHFMAAVRERADNCGDRQATLINFPNGAVLNLEFGVIRRRLWPKGPFLSLLDFNSDPQTVRIVIDFNHETIFDDLPHQAIVTEAPVWLRVLHERNSYQDWSYARGAEIDSSEARAIFPCLNRSDC
jgi:hypothetical protein